MIVHAQNSALAENVGRYSYEVDENMTHAGMSCPYQMLRGAMKVTFIIIIIIIIIII